MISREILPPIPFKKAAPRLLDTLETQHLLNGQTAEQQDQFWIQNFDLLRKIKRRAGLDFFHLRSAIGRRPAFQNVRDEEIRTLQPGSLQHILQVAIQSNDSSVPIALEIEESIGPDCLLGE